MTNGQFSRRIGGGAAIAAIAAGIIAALSFAQPQPAAASRPVRKTIEGCVSDGVFTSDSGYAIRVRDRETKNLADLSRFEGRRLRLRGDLLPGDNFFPVAPPEFLGKCAPRRR